MTFSSVSIHWKHVFQSDALATLQKDGIMTQNHSMASRVPSQCVRHGICWAQIGHEYSCSLVQTGQVAIVN
jgi:hypothetical protein